MPKKTKTQADAHQADAPFIPAELIAEFTRENAANVLTMLMMHAGQSANACHELARQMFGATYWGHAPALMGMATNPADYARAKARAMDAFVAGRMDAPGVGVLLTALADREAEALAALHQDPTSAAA